MAKLPKSNEQQQQQPSVEDHEPTTTSSTSAPSTQGSAAVAAQPQERPLFDEAFLNSLRTTSEKIRYLHDQGLTKSQIAKKLNKLYQHVRNVLNQQIKKQDPKPPAQMQKPVPAPETRPQGQHKSDDEQKS